MTSSAYWFTNISLSAMALIALVMLQSAPPRPKVWLCLAAIVAWCVPWPMLSELWSSSDVFVHYVQLDGLQALPDPLLGLMPLLSSSTGGTMPPGWIIVGISAPGVVVFIVRVLKHRWQLKTQRQVARPAKAIWKSAGLANQAVPVFVVDGLENAFVSGYFRPRIWIGRSLLAGPSLTSILRHELAHIQQRDNFILLFTTLLADIFYWNPLARVLARRTRCYIELSCDLACQKASPGYRKELAELLLQRGYRQFGSTLINPISRSRSFDVYRIRQLAKETSMKSKHVLSLIFLAVSGVFLISNVAISQSVEDEQQIVTHLTVKTVTADGTSAKGTNSVVTEFIGEAEAEKLLAAATIANVILDTYMESEFRRVVSIESTDRGETLRVLAALQGSGLQNIYDYYNDPMRRRADRYIYLDVDLQTAGGTPYSVELLPSIGHWSGIAVGDRLLRIRPDLLGEPGEQTVLLSVEISQAVNGTMLLIATPSLQTKFDAEAAIQIGNEVAGDEGAILSMTMTPSLPH